MPFVLALGDLWVVQKGVARGRTPPSVRRVAGVRARRLPLLAFFVDV